MGTGRGRIDRHRAVHWTTPVLAVTWLSPWEQSVTAPGAPMSSTEARLHRTFELLRRHLEREREEPVTPWASPDELKGRFPLMPPASGIDDDTLFDRLEALVAATPRTTTRRFYNQLFSGRDDFGSVGEILAAFLNSSMYTFKAAGPQVVLERELVGHMGRRIGYPDADGTFVPGGSMANLAGMLLARNRIRPESRDAGVDGPRLAFYASACCHYSVPKAAGILGIGRDQLHHVEVDERGRMLPEALRKRIESDLAAGQQPFLVMATAGTTVRGAYDPIEPIADVCEEFGLWLHVDGAMGGSAVMSDTHRSLLEGSERSDSFAWDAHKLLGVPLSCSAILVRERGQLFDSLSEQASYLFQNDSEYDLGEISLQCGRRNDALKLWAAWQTPRRPGLRQTDRPALRAGPLRGIHRRPGSRSGAELSGRIDHGLFRARWVPERRSVRGAAALGGTPWSATASWAAAR